MFSKAKIGDKVWNPLLGWGEIENIDEDVLTIAFAKKDCKSYSWINKKTGKYEEDNVNPAIYWQEFKIPQSAFIKPLPTDTKIIVWNNDDTEHKHKRYFSHFDDNGKICCFLNGATSWSNDKDITAWDNWELAEEENNEFLNKMDTK
jgi:hypothetical protein